MLRYVWAAALALSAAATQTPAMADTSRSLLSEQVSASELVDPTNVEDVSGFARLIRDRSGITVELSTTGLDPHRVHTVWWVVFNAPENCNSMAVMTPVTEGQRCSEADLFDPATESGVIWASVMPVSDLGIGQVSVRLPEGDLTGQTPLVDITGVNPLINSKKAEVFVDIRQHMEPGENVLEQITTFELACPPDECLTVQTSVFPGKTRKKR